MELAITAKFQSLLGVQYKSDGSNPIKYKLIYYWYMFWTLIGAEYGYLVVIPFWWWNVDAHVTRHAMTITVAAMYVGQWIKSYTPWPRPPSPPVVRLEHIYVAESTMPSTHACLGTALPFSILFFTLQYYDFSTSLGLFLATFSALNICLSRLYLGMHYPSDLIAGSAISFLMLYLIHSYIVLIDAVFIGYTYLCVLLCVFLAVVFPAPSTNECGLRADSCRLLGVLLAVYIGHKFYVGSGLAETPCPSALHRIVPHSLSFGKVAVSLTKFAIGLPVALLVRAVSRVVIHQALTRMINSFPAYFRPPKGLSVKRWGPYEVPFYLISYNLIALSVIFMGYPFHALGLMGQESMTDYPMIMKQSPGNPLDFRCVHVNYSGIN